MKPVACRTNFNYKEICIVVTFTGARADSTKPILTVVKNWKCDGRA